MMAKKEFEALLASIEYNGYDEALPIVLYENEILDGRNRYEACKELEIEPHFTEFSGNYNEAVEKSRMLNSSRRHMPKYQRAMIAAKEIQTSRENPNMKKLTIAKAAQIHSISKRIISDAMKVLSQDEEIAKLVYEGSCTLQQAQFKIDEIERIKNPPRDVEELMDSMTLDGYSKNDEVSTHQQLLDLGRNEGSNEQRTSYDESEIAYLQEKLNKCIEEKKLLTSGLAS